jgi:hypothetical protein
VRGKGLKASPTPLSTVLQCSTLCAYVSVSTIAPSMGTTPGCRGPRPLVRSMPSSCSPACTRGMGHGSGYREKRLDSCNRDTKLCSIHGLDLALDHMATVPPQTCERRSGPSSRATNVIMTSSTGLDAPGRLRNTPAAPPRVVLPALL